MAGRTRRVLIPVDETFRTIARIEKRSISKQGEVAIQQFVEQWRSALPSQDRTQPNIQKHE